MTKEEEWTLSYLQRAVAELQKENERLRATMLDAARRRHYDAEDVRREDNAGIGRE